MGRGLNLRKFAARALLGPEIQTAISAAAADLSETFRGVDADETEWEKLTDAKGPRELDPEDRVKIIDAAWRAFVYNPLGKRQVFALTSRLVGRGLSLTAKDEKYVQPWIDAFRVRNDFNVKLREASNRIILEGELFPTLFVSKADGTCRLREIEPREVINVVTDPDDYELILGFHRRHQRRVFNPATFTYDVGPSRDEFLKPIEFVGNNTLREILYFRGLSVATNGRGISDLASHIHYLRQYRKLLDFRFALNKIRAAVSLVLTLVGGSVADVIKKRKEIRSGKGPRPGAVYVKTERENIEFLSPNIGAGDARNDLRSFLLMVVAGSGLPEPTLTGNFENANYSSTLAGLEDAKNTFEDYQEVWGTWIKKLLARVIYWGKRYGSIPADADETVDIEFPTVPFRYIKELFDALAVAEDHGWASPETCSAIAGFDPSREKEKIAAANQEAVDFAGGGDYLEGVTEKPHVHR